MSPQLARRIGKGPGNLKAEKGQPREEKDKPHHSQQAKASTGVSPLSGPFTKSASPLGRLPLPFTSEVELKGSPRAAGEGSVQAFGAAASPWFINSIFPCSGL